MQGWHCYIFKTYPPDKLSKLRTTGPWLTGCMSTAGLRACIIVLILHRHYHLRRHRTRTMQAHGNGFCSSVGRALVYRSRVVGSIPSPRRRPWSCIFRKWSRLGLKMYIFLTLESTLGQVQTSNFSCAEPNVNELEQRILLICIRFGTWEVQRLN